MVTIYTHEPITWTSDTVNNLNTFNQEIKEKMTDIDTFSSAPKFDHIAELTPAHGVNVDGVDLIDSNIKVQAISCELINSLTTNHLPITPGTNKLVKIAVLRQNIITNAYINNTVILTGWKFENVPNILNYQAIGVTFGITFSEIPIVTVTPITKCVGSDPTTLTQLCGTNHMALETVKVGDVSTTGFIGELWSSVAYDAGDRVGFMWTAIGQLN